MPSYKDQHYVQVEYLNNWCANGTFAVATKNSVLANQKPSDHAKKDYYYKFVDLNYNELSHLFELVSTWFDMGSPIINKVFVPILFQVLRFRYDKGNFSDSYAKVFDHIISHLGLKGDLKVRYDTLRDAVEGKIRLGEEFLENMRRMGVIGFEHFEGEIEDAARPYLKEARKGNLAFMKEYRSAFPFILYLVNQTFRGPSYLIEKGLSMPEELKSQGISVNVAKYVRYFYPIWLANDFAVNFKDRKVIVLENKTDLEFITGDVPVVIYNTQRINRPLILFYPLTPLKALLFGFKNSVNRFMKIYSKCITDKSLVNEFNQTIVKYCTKVVFATSEDVIKKNGYMPRETIPAR